MTLFEPFFEGFTCCKTENGEFQANTLSCQRVANGDRKKIKAKKYFANKF